MAKDGEGALLLQPFLGRYLYEVADAVIKADSDTEKLFDIFIRANLLCPPSPIMQQQYHTLTIATTHILTREQRALHTEHENLSLDNSHVARRAL
jgi:hypothetical protein